MSRKVSVNRSGPTQLGHALHEVVDVKPHAERSLESLLSQRISRVALRMRMSTTLENLRLFLHGCHLNDLASGRLGNIEQQGCGNRR